MTVYKFLTEFIEDPSEQAIRIECPDDPENPNMRFNENYDFYQTVDEFWGLHNEKSEICELTVSSVYAEQDILCIVALR